MTLLILHPSVLTMDGISVEVLTSAPSFEWRQAWSSQASPLSASPLSALAPAPAPGSYSASLSEATGGLELLN